MIPFITSYLLHVAFQLFLHHHWAMIFIALYRIKNSRYANSISVLTSFAFFPILYQLIFTLALSFNTFGRILIMITVGIGNTFWKETT